MSPIIKAAELLSLKKGSYVLVDAGADNAAREKYNANHLDGALYADLNTQLAEVKDDASKGGRHPLPTPGKFGDVLSTLGISPNTHVVVYDDKNSANAAARFWWMLRSAGHEKIQVIDGGMHAAVKAGFAVNADKVVVTTPGNYQFTNWQLPLAEIIEVEKVVQDDDYIVIDVRDTSRYNGEREPIDLVAGHIPGATNIPFQTNLEPDGSFLSPDTLKEKYAGATAGKTNDHIVVHCGSGVTACHTLLAFAYAGLKIPKLYVGSWSEWSRTDRPQAKGDS